MLPTRSRRKLARPRTPTTTKASPRLWSVSSWVRRRDERAHRDPCRSGGAGTPCRPVDDGGGAGLGRRLSRVAVGRLDAQGLVLAAGFRWLPRALSLDAGPLVLGRRTLRSLRPSGEQLPHDPGSDA